MTIGRSNTPTSRLQRRRSEAELPELKAIASRVADPMLAYATDEDAGFGTLWPWSPDPLATRGDLGSDPIEYYRHRVTLSRELWANMEEKLQTPGEGYQILRRSFLRGLGHAGSGLLETARYIGGVYHYRDHVGDAGNRSAVCGRARREAEGSADVDSGEPVLARRVQVFAAAVEQACHRTLSRLQQLRVVSAATRLSHPRADPVAAAGRARPAVSTR